MNTSLIKPTICFAACLALVSDRPSFAQGTTYFPGAGEFGALLYEDLWPAEGDWDFNDLALRYNLVRDEDPAGNVTALQYTLSPQALGADSISSGLGLRLPVLSGVDMTVTRTIGEGPGATTLTIQPDPIESQAVLWLSDDIRSDLCGGQTGFINTESGLLQSALETMRVDISFATPQVVEPAMPLDLFLFRSGERGHQIHRPQYYGTDQMDTGLFGTFDDASDPPPLAGGTRWFVNDIAMPWAILVPEPVDHPLIPGLLAYPAEGASFLDAFPEYQDFILSGGTLATDWFMHPDPAYLYTPLAGTLPGDTDGDGDIDDADLGTAFSNYTGPSGAAGGKTWADGDTDGDGDVDDADLGTAFSNYTGPLGPTHVPEPASFALLGLAGLMTATRRRSQIAQISPRYCGTSIGHHNRCRPR